MLATKVNNKIFKVNRMVLPFDWFDQEFVNYFNGVNDNQSIDIPDISTENITRYMMTNLTVPDRFLPKKKRAKRSTSYNKDLITPVIKLRNYCITNIGGKNASQYLFLNYIISLIPSAYVVAAHLVKSDRIDLYDNMVNNFSNFIDHYIDDSKKNEEKINFISFFLRTGYTTPIMNFLCLGVTYDFMEGLYNDMTGNGEGVSWFLVNWDYDGLCATMAYTFYGFAANQDLMKGIDKVIFNYDWPADNKVQTGIDAPPAYLLDVHSLTKPQHREMVKKSYRQFLQGIGDVPAISISDLAATLNEIDGVISELAGVPKDTINLPSSTFAGWDLVYQFVDQAVAIAPLQDKSTYVCYWSGHIFNLLVNSMIAIASIGVDKSQLQSTVQRFISLMRNNATKVLPDTKVNTPVNSCLYGQIPVGWGHYTDNYFPEIVCCHALGTPGKITNDFAEIGIDYNFMTGPYTLNFIQFNDVLSGLDRVRVCDFFANSNSVPNQYIESLSSLDEVFNITQGIENEINEILILVDQIDHALD